MKMFERLFRFNEPSFLLLSTIIIKLITGDKYSYSIISQSLYRFRNNPFSFPSNYFINNNIWNIKHKASLIPYIHTNEIKYNTYKIGSGENNNIKSIRFPMFGDGYLEHL